MLRAVVIPRRGRPGNAFQAHEHRRAFRRTVKWRTGNEARISTLIRQYGWDGSRLDDEDLVRARRHQGEQARTEELRPHLDEALRRTWEASLEVNRYVAN